MTTRRAPAKGQRQSAKRSIPPHLERIALAKLDEVNPATGKAFTARAVAAWLFEAHQVKTSQRSVLRLRAAVDAKGEALYVEALRAELRDMVAPLRARLGRTAKRLDLLARKSRSVKDLASATNALTRALHEVAELGGVAAPLKVDHTTGGQPLPDARALLASRLASLAQEPDGDGASEAPGDASG